MIVNFLVASSSAPILPALPRYRWLWKYVRQVIGS
jgi:hypothetical protein